MGEVGNIAFADPIPLAVGLAEVNGFVDLAVAGGPASPRDMHVHIIMHTDP
jgi:hypothetical protein